MEKPKLTSTELASLWLTYQQKTMMLRMLEYFIAKAEDQESRNLLLELYNQVNPYIPLMIEHFQNEGAAVPMGFTSADVNTDADALFDNGFDLMFTRLMKQISSGMHTLHLGRAYREDIVTIFKELTSITQNVYIKYTDYLLKQGRLARSPYVAVPDKVAFAKKTNYMSGLNPFKEKRSLNIVEISQIYQGLENNIIGMSIMNGFHQTAKEAEVKKYFGRGLDLSKQIIKKFSEILIDENISVPGTSGATITQSTNPPFSDKLMLYCTGTLCSFSLGSNAIGTAFSMRSDLPAIMTLVAKDVLDFAIDGAKIMIKNGWLEEPPQI